MPNYNSQEHIIYRNLAGKIQMGFFDDGERFPTAEKVADYFDVSYCPAQRALKKLEKDGLIKLCRGKKTEVLAKPYQDYLKTELFKQRANGLLDLCKSMRLISPAISYHIIHHINIEPNPLFPKNVCVNAVKNLYKQFERSLHALGSKTVLSLYYDISSFAGSSLIDILYTQYGKTATNLHCQDIGAEYWQLLQSCQRDRSSISIKDIDDLAEMFYVKIISYLEEIAVTDEENQEPFCWEPHKGRLRHCDVIAIDMVCKISQGTYPVGSLLPTGAVLADIYHVSEITIRRTIKLLNKFGVTKTTNGVGTHVVSQGDSTIPHKLKALTLEDNMKNVLEALQMLAITGEQVFKYTFPYISQQYMDDIVKGAALADQKKSMVRTVGAGIQAIVHCCPLKAIQEIYSKLTLLLLQGSILRLGDSGTEKVTGWTEIAQALLESCKTQNSVQFAQTYRNIYEFNFALARKNLLELGINGVEEIIGFE